MITRGSAPVALSRGGNVERLQRISKLTPITASVCAALGTLSGLQAQQGGQGVEQIVITGSRIVRRDLNAPSPILTVDPSAFEQSSAIALETVLNQYPQFNPGATQFTASQNQPTADTSPGVSTLNMRGLGSGRSLVLVNGRRAQPINAALAVDVNTIPSAMIESVEVISGGAAATYGPDAMAGVVNFKLRTDFSGIKLNYQSGVTSAGDGEESRADLLIGGNFEEGRGNAVFSVSWASREAALQENRDFFVEGWMDPGTEANYPRLSFPLWTPDANNLPSQAAVNAAFPALPAGTQRASTTPFYINNDGSVFRLLGNAPPVGYTGPTTFPYKIRQNGALQETTPRGYVSSPLTRYSAFAHARYDVADNLRVFAQGTFVASDVAQLQLPFNAPVVEMPRAISRPFESPALAALLDSRPQPNATWRFNRLSSGYYGNRSNTNQTKLLEFIGGLEGDLPNDWTYEAYTTYGETVLLTNLDHQIWTERYRELATKPGFGQNYFLQPFLATTGSQQGFFCTTGLPLLQPWVMNIHGEGEFQNPGVTVSEDCLTAITAPITMRNTVKQRVSEFNVEGKLADMRAGELRSAFGISHRRNEALYEPDPLWDRAVGAGGETTVAELYGEVLVPIVERLELEFGARYSQFETGGVQQDANTYKALFNWRTTDALRLRGGYQAANRTPNVSELYSGDNRVVTTWVELDPCRTDTTNPWGNLPSNPDRAQVQELCRQLMYRSGTIPGNNFFDVNPNGWSTGVPNNGGVYSNVEHGNPLLKPEDSETWTLGIVWQAEERSLTVSADWYDIFIEEAVGNLNFQTAYRQCFNYTGVENPSYSPDNPYCRFIHRNPETQESAYVEAVNFNLGQISTTGLDLDVNWRREMAGGELGVRSSLNKLFEWKSFDVPGSPLYEYADSTAQGGLYDWQAFTTVSYSTDRLDVALNLRYLPEVRNAILVQTPDANVLNTDSYSVFNVNGGWTFNERLRLRGGVENVFDKDPPIVGAQPGVNNNMGVTLPSRYDPLGRRYFVGVSVDF
jgi:outer membrane receptor protein involved in Fe transport